jgi:uncharacterized membrane protein YphA (DoxX/SURF4 family)
MNGLLWIVQIILAVTFLVTGLGKLVAYDRLMGLVQLRLKAPAGISPRLAAILGIFEIAGAIGVVFPLSLTPAALAEGYLLIRLAAAVLIFIMVGAGIYHIRRNESAAPSVALFLMAVLVIYGRWPH